MPTESLSYAASWRKAGNRYEVWLRKRPSWIERGQSLDEALSALASLICRKTGDGEAFVSLYPLRPGSPADAPWTKTDWAELNPDGWLQLEGDGAELFSEGWCKKCLSPLGDRTAKPIRVCETSNLDVCSPWWTHSNKGLAYKPFLLSERALATLSSKERSLADWRPIQMPPRSRKRYFECLPHKTVKAVRARGWACRGNKEPCKLCGGHFVLCRPPAGTWKEFPSIDVWYPAQAIRTASTIVMACSGLHHHWLVPLPRAAELHEHPHMSGLRINPLGVLPQSLVMKFPARKKD